MWGYIYRRFGEAANPERHDDEYKMVNAPRHRMEPKQVAAMVLLLVVGVAGLAYTLDMSLRGAEREPSTCSRLRQAQERMP
jgi:hypothetical protein